MLLEVSCALLQVCISLAGDSETESQQWMCALRAIFSSMSDGIPHCLLHKRKLHSTSLTRCQNVTSFLLFLTNPFHVSLPINSGVVHQWHLRIDGCGNTPINLL